MQIFNTLSRQVEEVKPIDGDTIRIYSCGLTVYDYAHIGNLRKYIFDDLLKRSLIYFGYKVKHVMNVTDVGHLTSDEDEGEDKIEKGAARENKSAYEIARFYENAFVEDMKKLNILMPNVMPRATENIAEQIDLIKVLEEKGFTYKTTDGIYFDTSKLNDYGKLAQLDIANLREGARVEANEEKKNPTDFALWKFSPDVILESEARRSDIGDPEKKSSRRQMEWPSPWGVGFPGWHLECSAMSTKFLGQPFEIHTGGVDHIPVHHTNEIAQSEAAYGKPLAKYWIHSEHLLENGRKMAKSDGHFIRLQDLEEKGYSALDFRYMCLSAKYRSKLDFSYESLDAAKSARKRINDAYNSSHVLATRSPGEGWSSCLPTVALAKAGAQQGEMNASLRATASERGNLSLEPFNQAVSDDLDTPKALAFIFDNLGKLSKDNFEKIDEVLGILEKAETKTVDGVEYLADVPDAVVALVNERIEARKNKEFEKSDQLRSQIEEKGFLVEDLGDKTVIKKK